MASGLRTGYVWRRTTANLYLNNCILDFW